MQNNKELLKLAGKMADAARMIVGGNVLTCGRAAPANVYRIGDLCEKLREAVDAYDDAIIESMRDADAG